MHPLRLAASLLAASLLCACAGAPILVAEQGALAYRPTPATFSIAGDGSDPTERAVAQELETLGLRRAAPELAAYQIVVAFAEGPDRVNAYAPSGDTPAPALVQAPPRRVWDWGSRELYVLTIQVVSTKTGAEVYRVRAVQRDRPGTAESVVPRLVARAVQQIEGAPDL